WAGIVKNGSEKSVSVRTNRRWAKDLSAVERLCAEANVSIDNARINNALASDQMATWFIFNAGIYDPLHTPNISKPDVSRFSIGGRGADLLKGNYGWMSLDDLLLRRHKRIGEVSVN